MQKPSRKHIILICLLALFVFQGIQLSTSPLTLIASGSGFSVDCSSFLAFQGDNILQIEVLTGLINSSSASLTLYARKGIFSFNNLNDTTIEIISPDAEEGFDITINGATSTTQTSRFTHQATISTGDGVTITWGWRLESWIGNYTMFALGISGLILMIASPTWCAMTIKKKGLAPESFEMIMYALLIMCVGFGLVVMWLW